MKKIYKKSIEEAYDQGNVVLCQIALWQYVKSKRRVIEIERRLEILNVVA